tara:strand:+ start:821 stop:1114 length:294 start_codon:yes stop_codon:yes gene_type:complete
MFDSLLCSFKIVIFYFYSEECLDLNKLVNIIKDEELQGKNVHIEFINVEEERNKKFIEKLKLNIYPFFNIYKNGVLIEQLLGTLDNIHDKLNLYINI